MKNSFQLLMVCLLLTGKCRAIEQFVEEFSGQGEFASLSPNEITGFDNPGWELVVGNGEFKSGGFTIENEGNSLGETDILARKVAGSGSFVSELIIRDVSLEASEIGRGLMRFWHFFDNGQISIELIERGTDASNWNLFLFDGIASHGFIIDSGADISLKLHLDRDTSSVRFEIDHLSDNDPVTTYGPYDSVSFGEITEIQFHAGAIDGSRSNGILDRWSILRFDGIPIGDFNRNGLVDIGDIDLLTAEVKQGSNNLEFDLVVDEIVDQFDRILWVKDIANTWFGDSNLDGEFNSSDLVSVFLAGEYEDEIDLNSTWEGGDWDGDGDFNSSDLVIALRDGGYEAGPRSAVASVPEPSIFINLFWVMVCLLLRGSKQRLARSRYLWV